MIQWALLFRSNIFLGHSRKRLLYQAFCCVFSLLPKARSSHNIEFVRALKVDMMVVGRGIYYKHRAVA
jgi:hypothetical protein